jgi:hypothetical protein
MSIVVRRGMGAMTTEGEARGNGNVSAKPGPSVRSDARSAVARIKFTLSEVPADAVAVVDVSRKVGPMGGAEVSVSGSVAIGKNGDIAPLSTGIEAGRSIDKLPASSLSSYGGGVSTPLIGPVCVGTDGSFR